MNAPPLITVGIVSASNLDFVLQGDFTIEGTGITVSGPLRAFREGKKIVVEKDSLRREHAREVILVPVDSRTATFVIRNVTIGVQFHWQQKQDQRFTGSLKCVAGAGGVTAVNIVPVEEYLTSVISSEMSARCSTNLLQAHAITSRSWLLAQLERSRTRREKPSAHHPLADTGESRIRWYDREDHALYDVCADDHCQRYQGITTASTPNVRASVEATHGRVLMHGGGICDARFSKSCGGISEPFETVWEPVHVPYLVSVSDRKETERGPTDVQNEADAKAWIQSSPEAFCNTSDPRILSQVLPSFDQATTDFFRWVVSYSQSELSELIAKKSGIDLGRIADLVPVARGPSGRISRLKIVGDRKVLTIGKELEIRRTLSQTHLYSSAFVVEKSGMDGAFPNGFILRGAGWGHGVGLCQIGAAVMGEQGYSPEQILTHYFTGALVEQAYD